MRNRLLENSKFFICIFLLFLPLRIFALDTLSICVDPDWTPYEHLREDGKYEGIAADLFALIAARSGVVYRVVTTKDWDESVAFSKSGKCHALAFLNQTQKRDEWLIFSEPYFTDPNVIITRENHDYITTLAAVAGSKMALPKGSSILEKVKKDYPQIVIIPVESEKEAFKMVSQGKADMTLRSLTMALYIIKNEGWFNLKVAGEVPAYANHLRIGLNKEYANLRDKLNDGIKTLTPKEVREITSTHLAISIKTRPNYDFAIKLGIGFLLIFAFGIYWVLYQRRANTRLNQLAQEREIELEKQKEMQRELKMSQTRYQTLIEEAREGIVVAQEQKIVYSNPSFSEMTGYDKQEIENLPIDTYLMEEDKLRAMENHRKRILGENPEKRYSVRFVSKTGDIKWMEISGVRIEWDGKPATLNFLIDITERVQQEENIRHMAEHDQLTGLPNRWFLDDRLEQLLAISSREGLYFAVIFIDLNLFKPVNDKYGHDVGDMLLISVAGRIKALLRESDTVARVGGDEFVILLSKISNEADIGEVIGKIENALCLPFDIMAHAISISCAAGFAVYPKDGKTREALYARADKAMYANKKDTKRNI